VLSDPAGPDFDFEFASYGGRGGFRPIRKLGMRNTAAVVFVLQLNQDSEILDEASDEFTQLLAESDLDSVPVLLLVTSTMAESKADESTAVSAVSDKLKLEKLNGRQWKIEFVSSLTSSSKLTESLQWLKDSIAGRILYPNPNATQPVVPEILPKKSKKFLPLANPLNPKPQAPQTPLVPSTGDVAPSTVPEEKSFKAADEKKPLLKKSFLQKTFGSLINSSH